MTSFADRIEALRLWLRDAAVLPDGRVIWGNEGGPKPQCPYARLNIISGPRTTGRDDHTMPPKGSTSEKMKHQGRREYTLSCHIYGSDALERMERVQSSLQRQSVLESLRIQQIDAITVEEVEDETEYYVLIDGEIITIESSSDASEGNILLALKDALLACLYLNINAAIDDGELSITHREYRSFDLEVSDNLKAERVQECVDWAVMNDGGVVSVPVQRPTTYEQHAQMDVFLATTFKDLEEVSGTIEGISLDLNIQGE